jgi:hypothetical protein
MRPALRRALPMAVWLPLMVLAGTLAAADGTVRMFAAASIVVGLAAIAVVDLGRGLIVLAVWLAIVGTARRMFTGLDGSIAAADPFLIIAPLLFIVLALVALNDGALRNRSTLTNSVLALAAALTLSAVNPFQSDLFGGLIGIALVVTPMLAFFVGRSLVDRSNLRRLLTVVAALGVSVALYGLEQVAAGFPAWDLRWIELQGYSSLYVADDVVRPFASFASGSAFATFIAVGVVIAVACLGRVRLALIAPAAAIMAVAVWYSGIRTVLVLLVAALGLMIAARAGWGPVRAVVIGLAAVAAIPLAVGIIAPDALASNASGALAARQISGLTDPFGSDSTLTTHLELLDQGVRSAFAEPLGVGIGAVAGGERFGGVNQATETDLGDAGVAIGLLGLGLYLAVAGIGLARSYRLAVRTRGALELAALGILVVTFQRWLTGGMSSVTWLTWLVLGWVDRETTGQPSDPDEAIAVPQEARPLTAGRSVRR